MAKNISTHVLDTATGIPAADVQIRLYYYSAEDYLTSEGDLDDPQQWNLIGQEITNIDGTHGCRLYY